MVAGGFGPDLQHPQVSRSTEARQADGSRAWHTLAPMRRRRSNLTAAGTESAVYAIGGVTLSGRIRASVERFEDGAWHDAPRLPARRTRAGAAALGGPIFVAGGLVSPSSAATETVIALDPDMGGWRSAAPMRRPGTPCGWSPPLSTSTPSAGGQVTTSWSPTSSGTTPEHDTWTTVAPMERARALPGAAAMSSGGDAAIVVVGGARSPQTGVFRPRGAPPRSTG